MIIGHNSFYYNYYILLTIINYTRKILPSITQYTVVFIINDITYFLVKMC